MNNDQFLKLFQKTLFDLSYFNKLKIVGDFQIASTDSDNSIWWNNATITGAHLERERERERDDRGGRKLF